jgi:glycosyltransferase involved in cell wall biosynthesis
MKLSASMIVKNESSCLAKCLESLKGIDEIVICDTGSEDNTVEIAKKYTDKVFTDYKWNDNFAEARNYSLSKCNGNWILIIDADEYLVPGSLQLIYDAITKPRARVFNMTVKGSTGGSTHDAPRVFRHCPEIYWKGAIHNYISEPARVKIDGATIVYSYSEAHKKDPDRALRILSKEVARDPKLVREKYYLAREYWYRKNFTTALEWYNKYISVAIWAPEKADACLMKARCLFALKRSEEAKDACLQAMKINANFKEAISLMAQLCGPKNKDRWEKFADTANNMDVLFVRQSAEQQFKMTPKEEAEQKDKEDMELNNH